MSKQQYIKQRIRVYLDNCEKGEILYNFSVLKRLKKQWIHDYEAKHLYRK